MARLEKGEATKVEGESIRKFQGEAILGGVGRTNRDGPGDLAAGQLCGWFVVNTETCNKKKKEYSAQEAPLRKHGAVAQR